MSSEAKTEKIQIVVLDDELGKKIFRASGDNIALFHELVSARQVISDRFVERFLKDVPLRGTALWNQYLVYQEAHEGTGFRQFMAHVLFP